MINVLKYAIIWTISIFLTDQLPRCDGLSTNLTECYQTLSPEDESETSTWTNFQDKLQKYSGLNSDNYIINVACANSTCVINKDGSAVWEARAHLYSLNMLFTTPEADNSTTIDGCLCNNELVDNFNNCMETVRTRMLEQLDSVFLPYLTQLIEKDNCLNFAQNCLT